MTRVLGPESDCGLTAVSSHRCDGPMSTRKVSCAAPRGMPALCEPREYCGLSDGLAIGFRGLLAHVRVTDPETGELNTHLAFYDFPIEALGPSTDHEPDRVNLLRCLAPHWVTCGLGRVQPQGPRPINYSRQPKTGGARSMHATSYPWPEPVRLGQPEHREFEYGRHGTASLIAALDVATGNVTATDVARYDSARISSSSWKRSTHGSTQS